MRKYARFSYLFSVLSGLISLLLHVKATTGVWAGIPYRADVMVYPYLWLDRWAVGATVACVIFLGYGFLFSIIVANQKINDMIKYNKLKVLSGKP